MMMMMPRVLLLLSSGSRVAICLLFVVLMTKGEKWCVWWCVFVSVCVFVGVLRSQASCFSLLVGFSWLEILLFPFRLCGCEPLALL